MSRKVVEIPVEVWEFSLQDAEHIAALHRETLRLMNENARLRKAGEGLYGIACNAGPGEGRVEKLDAWRAAKEGKPSV